MEDNEIIELYWNRSQQAIVETSIKYGKQLHTLAERILYNHEDSEECVNDTYHIAWNTLPPKRPDYFFAYLAKITRNFCSNPFRIIVNHHTGMNCKVIKKSNRLSSIIIKPKHI